MNNLGKQMTRRVTMPIICGFIGLLTFPFGILFWAIGLWFMLGESKK